MSVEKKKFTKTQIAKEIKQAEIDEAEKLSFEKIIIEIGRKKLEIEHSQKIMNDVVERHQTEINERKRDLYKWQRFLKYKKQSMGA